MVEGCKRSRCQQWWTQILEGLESKYALQRLCGAMEAPASSAASRVYHVANDWLEGSQARGPWLDVSLSFLLLPPKGLEGMNLE